MAEIIDITKKKKADDDYSLIPPVGDPDVGKKVFACLAEVIQDRKASGRHARYLRNYELLRNKHWKREPSVRVPLATANFIFTHIQRTVNALTDNNPTFNVARVAGVPPEEQEKCTLLQHTAEHWWIEQEQQHTFERSVRTGETYGAAIEKVLFDIDKEYGIGEVKTVVVDPFYFGVYPTDLADPNELQESDIIFYFYPMPLRTAKAKWPKFAKEIKADSEIFKDLGDERKEIASGGGAKSEGFMSSIAGVVKEILNFTGSAIESTDKCLICEAWVKDRRVEKSETANEDGSTTTEEKPVYTGEIRYIVACNSGKVVLEDRDNPNINPNLPEELARLTYLYDKRPFAMVNSVADTTSAYGYSDIEIVEQLQMEVNKAISQFILLKDRASRRKIKNPRTSGVDNKAFTNTVGILNPSNVMEAGGITYMEEPEMPVDVVNAIGIFKDMMMFIAGTFDIDQAMTKGGNRLAMKSLQLLLERAGIMQRGKIREYSRLIRERGRMYISLVQNFYTEERFISFRDTSGDLTSRRIVGREMIIPSKLTVVDGSTMPTSKVQQREEAIGLRQMGVYDDEEILRFLDAPNRQELMKRKQAGPLGMALQKLEAVGIPPELMQYFAGIMQMDDKKFEQAIKSQEIPPFQAVLQNVMAQGQPQENPEQVLELKTKAADILKTQAEIIESEARKMLTIEKIASERVNQEVKLFGIKYDSQMLVNQKMKIATELRKAELDHAAKIETAGMGKAGQGRRPYGLKSDNQGEG